MIIGASHDFTKRDSKLDKFVVTSLAEREFVISAGGNGAAGEFNQIDNYNILNESIKGSAKSDNSGSVRRSKEKKRR